MLFALLALAFTSSSALPADVFSTEHAPEARRLQASPSPSPEYEAEPAGLTEDDEPDFEYSVAITMTAEGDVADYTPSVLAGMVAAVAGVSGYPQDQIEITVEAGSVIITITFLVLDEDEADTLATDLEALDEATMDQVFFQVTLANGAPINVIEVQEVEVSELKKKSLLDQLKDLPPEVLYAAAGGGGAVALIMLCILIKCCCCGGGSKKNETQLQAKM